MSKTSPKLINSTIWQHTLHLSEISFFVDFCHPYVVFCGQKNVTTLLMVFFFYLVDLANVLFFI